MPVQIEELRHTDIIIYFIKLSIISSYTYLTSLKILNIHQKKTTLILILIWNICMSIVSTIIQIQISFSNVVLFIIFYLSIVFSKTTKSKIGYSIIVFMLATKLDNLALFERESFFVKLDTLFSI